MRVRLALLLILIATSAHARDVATFSIVARDPQTGEMGVAVASRFFSVGSVVPYARADAGAVATQANANVAWGPRGLALLAQGKTAQQTLRELLRSDKDPKARQVGIVAADGTSATYSGPECNAWAGGRSGPNYAVQGNILAGEAVVNNMVKNFEETTGPLSIRLVAALEGGQAGGGDTRGQQSAALLIVKKDCGVWLHNDVVLRLQVDDNPEPIKELRRLVEKSVPQPGRGRARPGCEGVNGAPK